MISIASSIRFRKADGLLPSFDNVMFGDEAFLGFRGHAWAHPLYDDDEVTIQVKVPTGYTIDLYYSLECTGPWTKLSSGTKEVTGAVYDFWEVTIDMATFAALNAERVQFRCAILDTTPEVAEYWHSEPVEITAADDLLQIEYFNYDAAFEVDYSTGIVHLLRVPGQVLEYRPGGEISVFDNQNEVTKIKDEVKRVLVMRTLPVPRYIAEMIRVAVAHDKLFVDETEFVVDDMPEVAAVGSMVTVTVNLTQRNVIGLNTHDVGFDCDEISNNETMVLQELAASGGISFTVPEGYLIATITGQRTAGSPTIKAGTAPAGDDVLYEMALNDTDPIWSVATINTELDPDDDATLYVTISGVGATANIFVLLLKNRQ